MFCAACQHYSAIETWWHHTGIQSPVDGSPLCPPCPGCPACRPHPQGAPSADSTRE